MHYATGHLSDGTEFCAFRDPTLITLECSGAPAKMALQFMDDLNILTCLKSAMGMAVVGGYRGTVCVRRGRTQVCADTHSRSQKIAVGNIEASFNVVLEEPA